VEVTQENKLRYLRKFISEMKYPAFEDFRSLSEAEQSLYTYRVFFLYLVLSEKEVD
jgi:hypothetical protein